jgi:hypothetical protein
MESAAELYVSCKTAFEVGLPHPVDLTSGLTASTASLLEPTEADGLRNTLLRSICNSFVIRCFKSYHDVSYL